MMSERVKLLHYFTVIIILAIFIAGCNIFDFASDAQKSPTEKAEEAIRDGDYAEAKKVLAEAVKDSTDSYALYLDAKATLHAAGVDIFEIVELIEGEEAANEQNLGILEKIDSLSDEEKTEWYRANMAVSANLSKIFNEETDDTFKPGDIALGYTVSNLMSGVLGIRDTNRDGIIDDNDFELNVDFIENASGYGFDGGEFEDDLGNVQQFSGLEIFLGDFAGKNAVTGKIAQKSGYEPDDINGLIAFVLSILDQGTASLKLILQKNTSFESQDIDKYIEEIASVINFYWYDDGIDNDGDGKKDEETIDGKDNDGDGLVDEDSDYHPSDPTSEENTQYIPIWQKWNNR